MSEHRELEEAIDEEAILVAQILEDSIEKGRRSHRGCPACGEDPTEVAPRAETIVRFRCGFVKWRPPAPTHETATATLPSS